MHDPQNGRRSVLGNWAVFWLATCTSSWIGTMADFGCVYVEVAIRFSEEGRLVSIEWNWKCPVSFSHWCA